MDYTFNLLHIFDSLLPVYPPKRIPAIQRRSKNTEPEQRTGEKEKWNLWCDIGRCCCCCFDSPSVRAASERRLGWRFITIAVAEQRRRRHWLNVLICRIGFLSRTCSPSSSSLLVPSFNQVQRNWKCAEFSNFVVGEHIVRSTQNEWPTFQRISVSA